ncbi:hypothetical protein H0H92_008946 [Tricholoma furcatifolium]|nr:hypothetical protein H0H92_008946 [Tricholoma furcatifolium]
MSDDLIVLDSPPASPPLRIQWEEKDVSANTTVFDLPDAEAEFQLSPAKRSRAHSAYRCKKVNKRIRTGPDSGMSLQREPLDSSITPNVSGSLTMHSTLADELPNDNDRVSSPTPIPSAQSMNNTPSPTLYEMDGDWSYDGSY